MPKQRAWTFSVYLLTLLDLEEEEEVEVAVEEEGVGLDFQTFLSFFEVHQLCKEIKILLVPSGNALASM